MLQLTFNSARGGSGSVTAAVPATLMDLPRGQEGVVERLDLPDDISRRLMELGFLPGSTVTAAHSAPGGDPKVFRVDGSEVALRRETAAHIHLRNGGPAGLLDPE